MKDRDCESCKKFSRVDPHESEGYCDAKRTWVDPQEGEDCKMHEFTLHSATKYKDGTPIMSEPEKVYCETDCILIHGDVDINSSCPKSIVTQMSNQLDSLEWRVDEFSEEYDAVLKTHRDILEEHLNRICNLEHLYEQLISKLCVAEQHNGINFCGNCNHATVKDGICACKLSGEIVDPDSSSCSMFEPPF